MKSILLASRSPRRLQILRAAGLPCRAVPPRGVEEKALPGESPARLVGRLALLKALSLARRYPRNAVLGADTVVALQGRIFGKPGDASEALAMLQRLQGKTHEVWTGAAWVEKGGRVVRRHTERTRVRFKALAPRVLRAYVRTSEPYDKAGAYAIQGTAGNWVRRWEGDFLNVRGLPLDGVLGQWRRSAGAGVPRGLSR